MNNYTYITDFHKSRESKIGASDIPWLIPHPENPTESLAAYTDPETHKREACTAIDLYNQKKNKIYRPSGFAATMGHRLEPYALYEFIADNISVEIASEFLHGYMSHKIEQDYRSAKERKPIFVNPIPYNKTPFKHNTECSTDYGVAHADCIYDPSGERLVRKDTAVGSTINNSYIHDIITVNNLSIDLSKPFNIQAKSANYFSVNARKKDQYKGYDLDLKEWQGIPLGAYFQTQYEMLVYGIDVTYLALIYNTNMKYYWTIKANKKHQEELLQVVLHFKHCLDTDTPPRELAMNAKDIRFLYPVIDEDFRELIGDELESFIKIANEYHYAAGQEKLWKKRKEVAEESSSIYLKEKENLKGIIGGRMVDLANWKSTGGTETTAGLKEIREHEKGANIEKYLRRHGLVKKSAESTKANIKISKKILDEIEVDER